MFVGLINRLKEPSTWAGLAGIFLIAGVSVEDFDTYVLAASGFFGFLAIILPELRSKPLGGDSEDA